MSTHLRLPNNYSGLAHAAATPVMPKDDKHIWKRWLEWSPFVSKAARDRNEPIAEFMAHAQHVHRQRCIALLLQRCKWYYIERNRMDDPLRHRVEFGKMLDEYVKRRDRSLPREEKQNAHRR
jgi:hypothetical protein